MPETPEVVEPDTSQSNVVRVAPFQKWTYDDAFRALQKQLPDNYNRLHAYAVDKDHFQKGAEWVGPGDPATNDKIEKQFAPEDAIGEVLSNVENAFSEPQIGYAPIDQSEAGLMAAKKKGDHLMQFLAPWWDKRRMQEHVQERQRTAAWAGWADLRLWIPWRFLIRTGNTVTIKQAASFEEALEFIHVMAPLPKHGAIVVDQSTRDEIAIFLTTETEFRPNGERDDYQRAELMFLDPDRESDDDADMFLRIVYSNQQKPDILVKLPLKGSLLTAEMRGSVIITEPVVRTQRQLNFLCSLTTRMAETAAFRERYIYNAKPQGYRYPYTEGDKLRDGAFLERDEEGRQWQVIPAVRTLGANTTTELIGLPQYDDKGDAKGNHTPGVFVADPVDPGPYILATEGVRRKILRMCGQGHLGGVSNAESSGIAYEQARAVFEKDLDKRKVSEEGMLRDLLTAVVTLAEILSGTVGEYTEAVRLTIDQHINAGPRSPDLVRLDLEAYEAGVLSHETSLAKLGVEDTEAEMERVRRSAKYILSLIEKVTASQGFTKESMIDLLKKLNLPDDILNALKVEEPPEPTVPPSPDQ